MCEYQQVDFEEKKIKPQPPFIWPEPRILEDMNKYEKLPPFHSVFDNATSFCGVICDLDADGVKWLSNLMNERNKLEGKIVLVLYPACATKKEHLINLIELADELNPRLEIRLNFLQYIEYIPFHSLLIVPEKGEPVLNFGPCVFNYNQLRPDRVNLVASLDASALESWTRWFNWFWGRKTVRLRRDMVEIPILYKPQGNEEGKVLWGKYMSACLKHDQMEFLIVDQESGDVIIKIPDEELSGKNEKEKEKLIAEAQSKMPTVSLKVSKLDPLGDEVARIFRLGELAVIDKSTRLKPLEVPISPKVFGEKSQIRSGLMKKQNQYRLAIFNEKDQKRIVAIMEGISTVLTCFSYQLGDGNRWVPHKAKKLLNEEINARNVEGDSLLTKIIKGDVEEFVTGIKQIIYDDANRMYQQIHPGQMLSAENFEIVLNDVQERLKPALKGKVLPELSYMSVGFVAPADSKEGSDWGAAYSLIKAIARYPIDVAKKGRYFMRDYKTVNFRDVLEAMDIFGDPRLKNSQYLEDWEGAKSVEMSKFEKVDQADVDIKEKCKALIVLAKTGDWDKCFNILNNNH